MRHFIFILTIVTFSFSCGQNNTKQKRIGEPDNSRNPQVVIPSEEPVKVKTEPEQTVVTNSLETDAKRYAELLCIVQRQGQTDKIVMEMQQIVDRYSTSPKSTKFGQVVDQEFNRNCK